ncbi:hypothetical protein AO240_18905 [Pseudomonas sp. ICMP 460]|nr:hypothetical protein AO240_18905 [Pseudomonas sp. ICMP 460]
MDSFYKGSVLFDHTIKAPERQARQNACETGVFCICVMGETFNQTINGTRKRLRNEMYLP